jgi:hypothetical protein
MRRKGPLESLVEKSNTTPHQEGRWGRLEVDLTLVRNLLSWRRLPRVDTCYLSRIGANARVLERLMAEATIGTARIP